MSRSQNSLRRVLATVAVIVASLVVVVGHGSTRPADASPACGATLLAPGTWLQGRGVAVFSNGGNTFTGVSCNGVKVSNPKLQYGYGYQCVELAARLYQNLGWGRVYANGPASVGQFRYGAQYIPEGSRELQFYPVTSSYVPVPGDLLIEGGSTYGHVSIVNQVVKQSATVYRLTNAEENASVTGWHSYLRGPGYATGGYHPVRGFLHAPLNTLKSVAPAPLGYVTNFLSPTNGLTRSTSLGLMDLAFPAAAGSSTSTVATSTSSYDVAYLDATSHLVVLDARALPTATGVVAAPRATPSLALNANNTPTVAVTTSTNMLAVWSGGVSNVIASVAPGSSPSVRIDASGNYLVAYVASNGSLSLATSTGTTDLGVVVKSGTSPSLTFLRNGTWVIAFQNSSGVLQTVHGTTLMPVVDAPTTTLLQAGTSPQVAPVGAAGYEVAYNNSLGRPYVAGAAGTYALPLPNNLTTRTSPALAVRSDNLVMVAVVGSDGRIWELTPTSGSARGATAATPSTPSLAFLW